MNLVWNTAHRFFFIFIFFIALDLQDTLFSFDLAWGYFTLMPSI